MKISARLCSRCRSRSSLRYCAWIVRSRLVVGSSAINRRGLHEMPMAPTMRWRIPPDISCGYCVTRVSGDGICTALSNSFARLQAVAREAPSCTRIDSPTWSPIVNSGFSEAIGSCRILALEQHLAADDACRGRQDAQNRQRQRALAGPRLADDAQGFAGMNAQRHVIDRADHSGAMPRDVVGREVLQLEQRSYRYRQALPDRLIAGGAGGRI